MGPRRRRCLRSAAVNLVAVAVLAACGGGQDDAVSAVAERFLVAVDTGTGQEACTLLAPAARSDLEDSSGAPCAQAVLHEHIGPPAASTSVAVFDTMAQVRFERDTIFLARFDDDWLVVAAACAPRVERPYDCGIQVS